MGEVEKVLAVRKIEPKKSGYCSVELCETVHVHTPHFRFELSLSQFQKYTKMIKESLGKWYLLKNPKLGKDVFIPLGECTFTEDSVYPNRLEVELQTNSYIHIHLDGLNLRMTVPEFKNYVETLMEAYNNLG